MYTTIGIFAHVDAGKTTLSEQLLYHCGAAKRLGRVDHGDALLDYNRLERQRGVTIFNEQALFSHQGRQYQLIDTPGHADFATEAERMLAVLDQAILLVSCTDGIQSQTEIIWRLLANRQLPVIFFLNKADRVADDSRQVLAELREKFSPDIVDFRQGMNQQLLEELALRDDQLLERMMDGALDEAGGWAAAAELAGQRRIFPLLGGSALSGAGVGELLDALNLLSRPYQPQSADFAAQVYKIRHLADKTKLNFIKLLGGTLRVKDMVAEEKVHELRLYHGDQYTVVTEAEPGQLVALVGPRQLRVGMPLGAANGEQPALELEPPLTAQVVNHSQLDQQTLLACWQQLAEEDPALLVESGEGLITVRLMGPMQLEILPELFFDRFGHRVGFGPCRVRYQETIAAPVIGYGHYEPLRHYAEVHLRLDPLPYGSGIRYQSACSTDVLAANYQHLIESHIFERVHKGTLIGAPLSDVLITLLYGRAEEKHTAGGDFRQATYRAIRQGLEQADKLLLEPIYRFFIDVPAENIGRLMSDLQKRQGSFDAPQQVGERALLGGTAPVRLLLNYEAELRAFSHGSGRISLSFGGWQPCHNTAEVVAEYAYDKDNDPEHSSASIICHRGVGEFVPWYEVKERLIKVKY